VLCPSACPANNTVFFLSSTLDLGVAQAVIEKSVCFCFILEGCLVGSSRDTRTLSRASVVALQVHPGRTFHEKASLSSRQGTGAARVHQQDLWLALSRCLAGRDPLATLPHHEAQATIQETAKRRIRIVRCCVTLLYGIIVDVV